MCVVKEFALGEEESIAAPGAVEQTIVVLHHQIFGAVVANFPEANELGFGSGEGEGAAQPINAFTVGNVTKSGFAGRQNDQLSSAQIEIADFEGCEYAVFGATFAGVESSEASPARSRGFSPSPISGAVS